MPINSLYPGFVKLFYVSNGHPHVQVLPCDPFFAVTSQWFVNEKGGGAGSLWTASITAYVTAVKPLFPVAASFVSADLYTMASPTSDPLYRESFSLGIVGTSGSPVVPFVQRSMTFRSANGGIYRSILLETVDAPNTEVFPPYGAPDLAVFTHLTDADAWVKARDGGFLIASVRRLSKTNDALRKKYLLDA